MDNKTTYNIQIWTAWTGPVMVVSYLICWIFLGHNIPPPAMSLSAADLVNNYYLKYHSSILLGMSFSAWLGVLYTAWSVQLAVLMWQREKLPILSLLQLCGGILTGWLLNMCAAMWAWCAAYAGAPGIDPSIIQTVHTMAWYVYDMTWTVTAIQLVGCGAFAILDKRLPVLFPAWAGWLALATAATFLPLTFLPYFKSGAFAVDGWFSFYIVFGIWGLWFTTYTIYMFRAIRLSKESAPELRSVRGVSQGFAD